MRILVTGGGLLGRAVAQALTEGGDEVTVLDVREVQGAWRSAVGDLRDPDAVAAAVAGAEVVVHTAALHAIHFGSHSESEFLEINVTGTYNVLAAARDAGVRRVVVSSSTAVFAGQGPVLSDDLVPTAGDVYGLTKVLDEQMAGFFRDKHSLEVVCLRYGAIWQLLLEWERPDVQAVFRGKPDLVGLAVGGGVTDLRDAVSANVAAARRPGTLEQAYTVLPTTLFPGPVEDVPAALAQRLPHLVAELPATLSLGRSFDATRTERDLGIVIRHGQEEFLADALAR